ncbi:hypothetical protein [Streptomyces sp. NRRL S-378]|uniref:hypothetical protein n=1 Tax=Streptomyces sp. NRRL S-378 TaxID=1463904 RepID=UPI00131B0C11|nr:hypothetical protein [Streptomyces sp. NRRL S-378]
MSLVPVSEILMRTRLLEITAALVLTVFGALAPAAHAATVPAIDGDKCIQGKGSVEYESTRDSWVCVDGMYDGEPID